MSTSDSANASASPHTSVDTPVEGAESGKGSAGELHQAATPTTLSEASLAALLLYGLTLGDEDPALGVLLGARRELRLVESLAEAAAGPGVEFDFNEIAPVLESIGRRLDVAIELLLRAPKTRSASDPLRRDPEDARP